MAAMTPIFFPNFLKNWCGLGNNITMQYVEYWVYRISGFKVIRVTSYKSDEKKIKGGRHNTNIPSFLKNWCSLGINTCIQYVEHQMNWKSGSVDIWVTGHVRQRPCAAAMPSPADETVQKQNPPPGRGSRNKTCYMYTRTDEWNQQFCTRRAQLTAKCLTPSGYERSCTVNMSLSFYTLVTTVFLGLK